MKIDVLDPVVEAAPGQTATCRVRVFNDTVGPSAYRLRIVGLSDAEIEYPLGFEPLAAGAEAHFDVGVQVPREFAAGRHSLAVEVLSDRRGERAVLAGMTVDVSSIHKVAMRINPSIINGRTKGRFNVEIDNREDHPVDIQLHGEGQGLTVKFVRRTLHLQAGDVVAVAATVKARRLWFHDPIQHVVAVVAEGRSAPIYAEGSFRQKAVMPRRFRTFMVVLVILGLWAGILGVGAYWFTHRSKKTNAQATPGLVDTNGSTVPGGAPLGSLPTSGSAPAGGAGAGTGTGTGAGGAAGGAGGAGGAGQTAKTKTTTIGGTVKAGKTGQDSGVTITLAPALLGGEPHPTLADTASLARGGGAATTDTAKVWPDLYSRDDPASVSTLRQTTSLQSKVSDENGAWAFPDVLIRDNYKITFSKPNFDSKSFIVTPTEDGKAVALDVQLDPAPGSASGKVTTGGGAPLSGADIVITDGILTFAAKTSSQAGHEGTFAVAGLSTPNTYTLTATLRGYGTQVLQLKMGPGDQPNNIQIVMVKGVGSVSGHVTSGAAPVGGITITASSGDLTRTTTSLTGDGSYSIPQLTIPGKYTIKASGDGFITQTREMTLSDNATGIDFPLLRTTGSIFGKVVSDVKGDLSGVGIVVRHDALMFTATTANDPTAGAFTIDQLPPGDYLVTFSRYDHSSATMLVTLAAGENKPLGTIMLAFRAANPLVQNGRYVVSVVTSANIPLTGALVRLYRPSDTALASPVYEHQLSSTEASFVFENVKIGTYNVVVHHDNYRDVSKPLQMGLGEVDKEFSLLRLGQVSGRIIDASDSRPVAAQLGLKNYIIKIYRLKSDGSRDGAAVETIPVTNSTPTDNAGYFSWQSTPSSLIDGTYEVEVATPPSGYSVSPQILDPHTTNPAPMRFTILSTDENVLMLNPIKADPFPSLSGTIYAPVKNPTDPNNPGLTPVTSAGTKVTLACSSGTNTATAAFDATKGKYTFSSSVIGDNNLVGNCTLSVTNPLYIGANASLSLHVYSAAAPDITRTFDLALLLPVSPPVKGHLFWTDKGLNQDIPITTGIKINTQSTPPSNIIVGYDNSSGTPVPIVVHSLPDTPATSDITGGWQVVGQVFGQTTYTFTDPLGKYEDATAVVIIDETGTHVATGISASANIVNSSIDIGLVPKDGTIGGTVGIATVKAVKDFSAITVTATDPLGAITTQAPSANGVYSIAGKAGTWHIDFSSTSHYVLAPNAPTGYPSPQVPPAGAVGGLDTNYIELGDVNVTVKGTDNNPINDRGTTPTVTLTRVADATQPGDPGASNAFAPVVLTAVNGTAQFGDLAVNTTNPTTAAAQYRVAVTMTGFDVETASVVISSSDPAVPSRSATTFASGLVAPVRAGETITVVVTLAQFGSLHGEVMGLIGNVITDRQEHLPYAPPLVITATRFSMIDGSVPPTSPTITVDVDPADRNGFRIIGPPGKYTIQITHPQYEAAIFAQPAFDDVTVSTYTLDATSRTFTSPFVLRVLKGTITVHAVDGAGAPIGPATVTIAGGAPTGTDNGGLLSVGGFVPGDYFVEVHFFTPLTTSDQRFPVKVMVTVPRGSTALARTVTFTAKLVSLGGSITGTVTALNDGDRAVPFPAHVTITRTYVGGAAGSAGDIDGTPTANSLRENALSSPPDITEPLAQDNANVTASQTFTFDHLPAGVHHLKASDEGGYITPTIGDAIVDASAYAVPAAQLIYRAHNVDVTVNVTTNAGAPINNATVTFKPPAGVSNVALAQSHTNGTNSFAYSAVLPEMNAYRLTVTAPRFSDVIDRAESIDVITTGPFTKTIVVTLTGNSSVVNGHAKYQETHSTTSLTPVPQNEGSIRLFNVTTGLYVGAAQPTGPGGSYSFDIAASGTYRIDATAPNHLPGSSANFVATLGTDPPDADVVMQKLASQTFVINAGLTEVASITSPVTAITPTCATNSCEFDSLVPGTAYTFSVGATNRRAQTFTITPGVGDSPSQTVTLVGRTISVDVTTLDDGPDTNTNPDNPGDALFATVALQIPAGTTVSTQQGLGRTSSFSFGNTSFAAGQLVVSISGYRTRIFPFGADAGTDPATVAAAMHQLVVFDGLVNDKNGNAVGGATVTVTNTLTGLSMPTTTSALTNGKKFDKGEFEVVDIPQGVWTVTADLPGTGVATSATITIDDTNHADLTPIVVPTLSLQPRNTARTFHVTELDRSGANPVNSSGATVAVTGFGSSPTDGSGNATFQIPEDQALPAWSVTKSTFMPVSSTDAGANPASVTLHPTPTITGIISSGSPAAPLAGVATVWFCSTPSTAAQCDSAFTPVPSPAIILGTTNSTAGTGSYTISSTLPATAGTYRVKASFTDTSTTPATVLTSTFTVTVTATGGATSSTGTFNMTLS